MPGDVNDDGKSTDESPMAIVFWVAFAAGLGFCAVVLPPYLIGQQFPQPFDFFRTVTIAIERGSYWSLILLVSIGAFVTWRSPHLWALKCCATMVSFPLIAIMEMKFHPTSHNLFPLEFAIYAAETIPALFGGAVAVKLAPRRSESGESGT